MGPYSPGISIIDFIEYIDNHTTADPKKRGFCARAVRRGLEAGGAFFQRGVPTPVPAKDWGPVLETAGFDRVDPNDYSAEIGDVVVFQDVDGHPYGHIAGFDGAAWVSDFQQKNFFVAPQYMQPGASYTVYRHP